MNIEVAGEFIVMASMLMRVKSRMLLPRIENSFDEQLDLCDNIKTPDEIKMKFPNILFFYCAFS